MVLESWSDSLLPVVSELFVTSYNLCFLDWAKAVLWPELFVDNGDDAGGSWRFEVGK